MTGWKTHPSVRTDIGTLERVLVHGPGEEFKSVIDPDTWNWDGLPRQKEAAKEHNALVTVLEENDVTIHRLDEACEGLAESMFVRDVAFAIEGGVVVGKMAEWTRRGEERRLVERVVELGMPVYHTVHGPGGFEASNVAWLDEETVAIGRSKTTNAEGIRQIRSVLDTYDIEIVEVPIFGSTESTGQTHLALVFSMIRPDLALVYPQAVPSEFLSLLVDRGIEVVEVPMREQRNRAVSTIVVKPGHVLLAAGNPITHSELTSRGIDVTELNIREIRKTGGGLKGMVLPLERSPP